MLRSIAVVVVLALYLVFVATPVFVYCWITRDDETMYRFGARGVRLALWVGGVRLTMEGRERLRAGETYIFMANHVSNVDPLALIACLPRIAGPTKHTVFRIPVLGPAMKMVGFIPVVRGTSQAAAAVEAGAQALRSGRSLFVHPEGTRSATGQMLPFRRGVFVMALRAGVPVVPVTIIGSRDIMRKGDPRIHPGQVRLVIHEPIPTAGLSKEERFKLADRVRQAIASALPQPPAVTGGG
jgi:1-acyl-sn-glycerol-3-phosphate acyltransferase